MLCTRMTASYLESSWYMYKLLVNALFLLFSITDKESTLGWAKNRFQFIKYLKLISECTHSLQWNCRWTGSFLSNYYYHDNYYVILMMCRKNKRLRNKIGTCCCAIDIIRCKWIFSNPVTKKLLSIILITNRNFNQIVNWISIETCARIITVNYM